MHKGQVIGTILTTLPVFFFVLGVMGLLVGVAFVLPSHDLASSFSSRAASLGLFTASVQDYTFFEGIFRDDPLARGSFSSAFVEETLLLLPSYAVSDPDCFILVHQRMDTNASVFLTARVARGKGMVGTNEGATNYLAQLFASSSSLVHGRSVHSIIREVPYVTYLGEGVCDAAW